MKRTKEAYFREHPEWQKTEAMSGVVELEGEDRGFYDRKKAYNEQQKQEYLTQMKEKQERKQVEKHEQQAFDKQTAQVNRMRGLLQDEHRSEIGRVEKAHDNYNLQLWEERKKREQNERKQRIEEQRRQLQILNQRKVKRAVIPREPPLA